MGPTSPLFAKNPLLSKLPAVKVSEEEKGVRRVCVKGWAPENHQGGEVSGPADYIETALVHYLQFWFFGSDWDRRTEKTILKLKKEIARRFLVNEELKRRYNEDASRGYTFAEIESWFGTRVVEF